MNKSTHIEPKSMVGDISPIPPGSATVSIKADNSFMLSLTDREEFGKFRIFLTFSCEIREFS